MKIQWFLLAGCVLFTSPIFSDDYTYQAQRATDAMPVGAAWNGCDPICEDEDRETYVCMENCIYDCLNPCCVRGVWLPEAPPLFLPFKADPRQLEASVGIRFGDQIFGTPLIDVSYFDTIPIIRFFNIFTCYDQLELDLDGAAWAFFQTFKDTSPLVNTDYYIGASLNYALDRWSFRLRFFHISSHIGDEFLLLNPGFDRRNPSAEYLDIFASYQALDPLRVYGGFGYIPFVDPTFKVKRWYVQGGAEYYVPFLQFISICQQIEGSPYAAVNLQLWDNHNWNPDQTYVVGYEFKKLYGLERKLRFYMQYHDGYSFEGQFCDERTQYFSVRASYGF